MSDQLKKDLKAIADGRGGRSTDAADPKAVAKRALDRIEQLEKKPEVKKDTLVTNE
jgi:hypothetical protein